MEQDFDRLRLLDKLDEGVDAFGLRGLQALCTELGIPFNELDMFVLIWKIGATQSYCVTRSEWLHAAHNHKIEHLGQLKAMLATWRASVRDDPAAFAEMYCQSYDFIRGDDEKLLPLDKALRVWPVLLPEADRFAHINHWLQWCAQQYKRPVSRDIWRQVLEFSVKVKDITTYDPNDKWPTALDDFVEWALEHTGKKAASTAGSTAAVPSTTAE